MPYVFHVPGTRGIAPGYLLYYSNPFYILLYPIGAKPTVEIERIISYQGPWPVAIAQCIYFYLLTLVARTRTRTNTKQTTQKPTLRAEVYARTLRASQNRKEDSV